MVNKTFRKPHDSTKDATAMSLYLQHREVTLWDAKGTWSLKHKRGGEGVGGVGRQWGGGFEGRASDHCQTALARVVFSCDCGTPSGWNLLSRFQSQLSKHASKSSFKSSSSKAPPTGSNNPGGDQPSVGIRLQSDAGPVVGWRSQTRCDLEDTAPSFTFLLVHSSSSSYASSW